MIFFTGAAYDMHCKSSGNRTQTFMIYLNDGFVGGGTNFPNLNKTVEPETGKGLWWENIKDGEYQNQYLHEGVSIEKGKKIYSNFLVERKKIGTERAMKVYIKKLKLKKIKNLLKENLILLKHPLKM